MTEQAVSRMSDAEMRRAVASRIRQARTAAGMTQAEAGAGACVTHSTVSLWESAENAPTAVNVIRLAASLGVTAGWLLLDEGEGP